MHVAQIMKTDSGKDFALLKLSFPKRPFILPFCLINRPLAKVVLNDGK